MKRAWLFDGDGVLYKSGAPLPGAVELIEFLLQNGKEVALITNNSTKTIDEYANRLQTMGINFPRNRIFTSAYVTTALLKEEGKVKTAYVLGCQGIIDACEREGIQVVNEKIARILKEEKENHGASAATAATMKDNENTPLADAVIAGMDLWLTYERLAQAVVTIERGARFIGTNPDRNFPSIEGFIPGAGSIIAAVETATGQKPEFIAGKPEAHLYRHALQQTGVDTTEAIMIGDRLETDILGAAKLGMDSLLVRTGIGSSYSRETLEEWHAKYRAPGLIAEDLTALLALLQQ